MSIPRRQTKKLSTESSRTRLKNNISIIHTRAHQYQDQIVQLWKECLPGTSEERFNWMASGNPAGPAVWFLAFTDEERLVAATSVMPKEFYFNGRQIRGGIIGDIMVADGVRGKGIARQLQKRIMFSLPELGMEFFYVVPNNKSKHLFLQFGEMVKLRLKNYLIPVDVEHYLKKISGPFFLNRAARCLEYFLDKFTVPISKDCCVVIAPALFDEEVDALWESVKDVPDLLIGSKSTTYLYWKYCTGQNKNFHILKYILPSGQLIGYCVFLVEEQKIHLYELVSSEKECSVGLISALKLFAKEEHCVGIYFYTTPRNPILKQLWWRGLCRIGGDMDILCSGNIFGTRIPWLFFAGDRNL